MARLFFRSALLAVFLLFAVFHLSGQETDTLSIQADSLVAGQDSVELKKTFFHWFTDEYPNPKKALLLSIIPGGGQAYNKKWWKMPLVYGAMGGMVYLIDRNTNDYLYFKRAYRRKVRSLPHDLSGQGGLDSPTVLKKYRDQADKNTQLSYIGLVAVFGLAGVEAFVDAHLSSFDISDDLSLRVGPKDLGVGITLVLR